jgi:transaldolase
MTKIQELAEFGQSIWLDYISRSLIEKGRINELVELGVRGMTSNPSIFDKAVGSGCDYDEQIRRLQESGKSVFEIYDDLTVRDIQDAADILRPVYERTKGFDGYVSLEINPHLARQTAETIEEGRRLHGKVNRPNVMFKVPSTEEGFGAIEALLAEGININVTLIFSQEQYVKTAEAFLSGMSRLAGNGGDLTRTNSVASVFVSRIDTAVDKKLDQLIEAENNETAKEQLLSLRGKAAVTNSELIYQRSLEIFSGKSFEELKKQGANVQRVLWGSTGTKDPAYSDIKYVTELIAKNTVNTLPEKTLDAFLDHGSVGEAVTSDAAGAQALIGKLGSLGIDINEVCARLLEAGVVAFADSFDNLLSTIGAKGTEVGKK